MSNATVQIVVPTDDKVDNRTHLYLRIYYLYDDTAHMICSQTNLTVPRTKLRIDTTRFSYINNRMYCTCVIAITYVLLHLYTINRRSGIFFLLNAVITQTDMQYY